MHVGVNEVASRTELKGVSEAGLLPHEIRWWKAREGGMKVSKVLYCRRL